MVITGFYTIEEMYLDASVKAILIIIISLLLEKLGIFHLYSSPALSAHTPIFCKKIFKSCKQVRFFRVLSHVFLQLGRFPLQMVQP